MNRGSSRRKTISTTSQRESPQQGFKTADQSSDLRQQAIASLQQGKHQDAVLIYQQLIARGEANHADISNAAALCNELAAHQDAEKLARLSIASQPDYPNAHNILSNALIGQDKLEEALPHALKAIELNPSNFIYHYNHGNILQKLDRPESAVQAYEKALHYQPDHPQVLNNLGNALRDTGNIDAALHCYRRILEREPNHAECQSNLGLALSMQGHNDSSIKHLKQALQINPNFAEAYSNLGAALEMQGNLTDAIAAYRQAITLKPNYPEAIKNLGMAELMLGDYQAGWLNYDYRLACGSKHSILHAQPACPRKPLEAIQKGEQLLLVSEQGLGDTLQFMRYVPILKQMGASISLCAPINLHQLIKVSGIDAAPLTPEQANRYSKGRWLPLLSVPQVLGVTPSNPIVHGPYLQAPDELIAKWRQILARETRPLIGIHWQGNPDHEVSNSRGRSLPLETFAPLAARCSGMLISLQKGFGQEQRDHCSFKDHFVACQGSVDACWDFVETAAILANCDLVITSDSALAHLAAGMGRPTWLLLKRTPEWRWGLHGEQSFWYPTMRLFRQEQDGDWDGLMARVTLEVEKYIASDCQNTADQQAKQQQELASTLLQQGKLAEAEAIYRQLISDRQANAICYQQLASIYSTTGRSPACIHLLRQALEIEPSNPDSHVLLGHSYQQNGDNENALAAYGEALRLQADHNPAHLQLGRLLKQLGRFQQAAQHLQSALDGYPDLPADWNRLGICLRAMGELEPAIAAYTNAIALAAHEASYHVNLATALDQAGQSDRALATARQAVQLDPHLAEAWNVLGIAAFSHRTTSWPRESIQAFRQAKAIKPDFPDAWNNLGLALQAGGAIQEAMQAYRHALTLRRDYASAHLNLATAQLLTGDYANGWSNYELRLQAKPDHSIHARPSCQRWDGTALAADQQLLLVSEQGLGDTLQFMRYALVLRQQGIQATLCAPSKLHGLIRSSGLDPAPLTPEQANTWQQGCWTPLLSVGQHLGISPTQPLISHPYLKTSTASHQRWQAKLAHEPRPLIALHWQGNPAQEITNSQGRSLPLEAFAALAEQSTASLVSVQKGYGQEQLAHCSFRNRFVACQDEIDACWDFEDTAAILAHCDLVITSDSAIAHLAGGMGLPTWLLLKKVPDWRWGLEGSTTFWYPSLRLFRQRRQGDWQEVVQRVVAALPGVVAQPRACPIDGKPGRRLAVELPLGDALDRLAILKRRQQQRIGADPERTHQELAALEHTLGQRAPGLEADLAQRLDAVHSALWQVEQTLRQMSSQGDPGPAFLHLSQSFQHLRDERSALIEQLNQL